MNESIILFISAWIIFIIIALTFRFAYKTLKNNSHNRLFNLEEYLPLEEIQTLKQVSYLIMMTLFFIDISYNLVFYDNNLIYFAIYDIALCLFTISILEIKDYKSYILLFALTPFSSLAYLCLDYNYLLIEILSIINFIALIYMISYFYHKFKKYTKSNGLGYAIILLFSIIFVSFILTSFVEDVNLLDSLVMVSNAFTSNGYAILGKSVIGKINGLFLVWSGYVLSGVGTATLTTALIIRHYNKKFDELKELIEELKENK